TEMEFLGHGDEGADLLQLHGRSPGFVSMGRSCVWAGLIFASRVPEADYCTERKQSLDIFNEKGICRSPGAVNDGSDRDRRTLPPYPVRGRVRDSRSTRSPRRLGVDQVCAEADGC